MSAFLIYDAATGRIVQRIITPYPELIEMRDGQCLMRGDADPAAVYLRDGEITAYPPSPGAWAVFDFANGEWRDPRDEAGQDQARRAEASAYLAETDWMVIRAAEGGKPVPDDITARRAAARAVLSS